MVKSVSWPTMTTSSSATSWRFARAWRISPGASSPCTRTGAIRTRRSPKRRPMMFRMSRIAAPLVEEAFGFEPALELLERELERAQALGLHHLDHKLVLPPRGVDVEAAES